MRFIIRLKLAVGRFKYASAYTSANNL